MSKEPLKSVLITGGGCFVGYHIASRLLELEPDCQLSILDLPTALPRFPQATYYDVDVSSKQDVEAALAKIRPRVIFHAACTYSLALPAATHARINTDGTVNVLKAAQAIDTVKVFIYHSSSSVIETGTTDLLDVDETAPVLFAEQKFPYPLSKALAESYVLADNRKHGILTVSIRPAGTFGEADSEMTEKLLGVARSGRAKMQMGDGRNVYDFLYVGNLAHAHLLAARALLRDSEKKESEITEEDRVDGQAFHITNDEPWLFWEFNRAIAKHAGYPVKKEDIKVIPVWVGMLMAFLAEWFVWTVSFGTRESNLTRFGVRYSCISRTLNIEKAQRVLGYQPIYLMNEAIERTMRWYTEQERKSL